MTSTRRGRRGDEEAARLGQDLDLLGEEAVEFAVERSRQVLERLDVLVVGRGKAAADVEQVQLLDSRGPALR